MCPFCIANMAVVAAAATSTGGVAALVAKRLRSTIGARAAGSNTHTEDNRTGGCNGDTSDRYGNSEP
jgi:hypothetical protein